MKNSFFVVGTDTNVGKTYVSHLLLKHFAKFEQKVIGMKPVAAGTDLHNVNPDVEQLRLASNIRVPYHIMNPYLFHVPASPHIASREAKTEINIKYITEQFHRLTEYADTILVEGAGGLLAPISNTETMLDIAVALKIPLVLVVGMRLGCLNHALLTVEVAQKRGLKIAGWIANQLNPKMKYYEDNIETLKKLLKDVKYLGEVPYDAELEQCHFNFYQTF